MSAHSLPAPDAPLGRQIRNPSESLSAFSVLRAAFFRPAPAKRERLAAATVSHSDA